MKILIIFVYILKIITGESIPIVLWHGMGDTCCTSFSLGYFKQFLQKQIPGAYVHSLMIGNSIIEDMENGFFMSPNKQIDYAYKKLVANPSLNKGFNVIGFSQGSQFLRALVQRYGHKLPPIGNLVSLGGQHQGVYGLPHCSALKHTSCEYIREILNYAAYNPLVQDGLVQATYWHDPMNETLYKKNSKFLADINNERQINKTYIKNLSTLKNFVMVKFDNDSIVQPKETEWFGFYAPKQTKKLLTLQESRIYIEGRLGLKKMDEAGKLKFLSTPGDHLHFTDEWFINNIIKPYLI